MADIPLTFVGSASRTRYKFPARGIGLVDSRDVAQLIADSGGKFEAVI